MSTPADTADTPSHDEWGPCAEGTLGTLNRRLRAKRGARYQTHFAGGAIVAASAILAIAFWPSTATPAARVNCKQCHKLMPAFHQKQMGQLPIDQQITDEQEKSVDRHLNKCRRCRKHYESEYPSAALPAAATSVGLGLMTVVTFCPPQGQPQRGRPQRGRSRCG